MSGQLILVRHSLPEINNDLPARDWRLSEEGKIRAKRLAERVAPYRPERLVSSPEPKALETAEILGSILHLSIEILEALHEHERSNIGYLPGVEFHSAVRKFFEEPESLVFGSETAKEAFERFSKAAYPILVENKNSTPAIVSHGTVISLFVSRLTGRSDFQIWNELGLPGFIVLDLQSNGIIALENIL